jgi:hypothetical protein
LLFARVAVLVFVAALTADRPGYEWKERHIAASDREASASAEAKQLTALKQNGLLLPCHSARWLHSRNHPNS